MTYGHAERNLALIRQLEAETRQLLENLGQPDARQSAWLQDSRPENTCHPPLHTLVPSHGLSCLLPIFSQVGRPPGHSAQLCRRPNEFSGRVGWASPCRRAALFRAMVLGASGLGKQACGEGGQVAGCEVEGV